MPLKSIPFDHVEIDTATHSDRSSFSTGSTNQKILF